MLCNICGQEHSSTASTNTIDNLNRLFKHNFYNKVNHLYSEIFIQKEKIVKYYTELNNENIYSTEYRSISYNYDVLLNNCRVMKMIYSDIILCKEPAICWNILFEERYDELFRSYDDTVYDLNMLDEILEEFIEKCEELVAKPKPTFTAKNKSKKIIQTNIKEQPNCSICLEPKETNNIVMLNCDHTFCANCVVTLLQTENKPNCPLCRTQISDISLLYTVSHVANINKETVIKSETAIKLQAFCN